MVIKPRFASWVKWIFRSENFEWFSDEGAKTNANDPTYTMISGRRERCNDEQEIYFNRKYGHLPWTECKFKVEDV